MKHLALLVALLFGFAVFAFGGDLTKPETESLIARASKLTAAMESNDAEAIIHLTHPSIYALTNGKEGFHKLTRSAMEQVKDSGVRITESTFGKPSPTYPSGTDTVCFLPRTSIFIVEGKKYRSIGFLVAVRGKADTEWLFLDGTGFSKNPAAYKTLLPGLPVDAKFPEYRVEEIE